MIPDVQIAVIGAGPAGMAAAVEHHRAAARTGNENFTRRTLMLYEAGVLSGPLRFWRCAAEQTLQRPKSRVLRRVLRIREARMAGMIRDR